MGSKKLLLAGGVIALVAASAILVPNVASGVGLAPWVPASSIVAPDDGPGNNGRGNAFGHDKDSPDFPGNGNPGAKNDDGPGNNGRGNAFGHDKDSPDFPGNNNPGAKNDDGPGNARGNAFGHDKDSPDFPGNNGRGEGDPDDD